VAQIPLAIEATTAASNSARLASSKSMPARSTLAQRRMRCLVAGVRADATHARISSSLAISPKPKLRLFRGVIWSPAYFESQR